jgi:hypothetical protein
MASKKPVVFIGSSLERIQYANAVFSELELEAEPITWDLDFFRPSVGTLEQLEKATQTYDFAVLVLTPDDVRRSRGKQVAVPRDNVVFELGLFVGALGRNRVFFIKPRSKSLTLPTDLLGITALEYTEREDENHRATVRTACSAIKRRMSEQGKRIGNQGPAKDVRFWHTVADRQRHTMDVRALIEASKKRVIISGISLAYIGRHCVDELRAALARDVLIGIAISNIKPNLLAYYSRYSRQVERTLTVARRLYVDFHKGLTDSHRQRFCLCYVNIPLTHSIGLYDDEVFVSQFCLDVDSSKCPSFAVKSGAPSFSQLRAELRVIFSEGLCVAGGAKKLLLSSLRKT